MGDAVEDYVRLGNEVASYFTPNPKYEFLGFAGLGRHGGALILSEKSSEGEVLRKMVIKYSYGHLSRDTFSDADGHLRNEYHLLERLRGAEHIVQLVPMADCSIDLPGMAQGEDDPEGSSPRPQNQGAAASDGSQPPTAPEGRRCPTFALEFLPGGTLEKFLERCVEKQKQWIPNRILWRIWLCMVRQCVAMAFPPDVPEQLYTGEVLREHIIPLREQTPLTQNSSHSANFVFGDVDLEGIEHNPGAPILKLIDFGRGQVEAAEMFQDLLDNPYEIGSRMNLSNAAYAMMQICCIHTTDERVFRPHQNPRLYTWMDQGNQRQVYTMAPKILRAHRMLDPRLRHLLVRCHAIEYNDIPSLQEVLNETELAVANNDPFDPRINSRAALGQGVLETDEYIRNLVQEIFHNAD